MTIPPMVARAVPIAVPISRTLRENVFLPVTTKMIISVTRIVCVTEIVSVTGIICVPEIISVRDIVSVTEVASVISLVPHACDRWISVIREPWESVTLVDSCSREWTGPGIRYAIWIHVWATKRNRPRRTHCDGRTALDRRDRPAPEAARRHGTH